MVVTGTIPIFQPDNYIIEGKYKIKVVYIDVETSELVIEYEIVE